MRFTKRLMRDFKVMDLVNREKGSDPDLDINVKIVESAAVTESMILSRPSAFGRPMQRSRL